MPKQIVMSTAWVSMLFVGGLVNTGMMYQQFQTLKEERSKDAAMLVVIRENQIGGLADVRQIKSELVDHNNRIVVIERYIYSKDRK